MHGYFYTNNSETFWRITSSSTMSLNSLFFDDSVMSVKNSESGMDITLLGDCADVSI